MTMKKMTPHEFESLEEKPKYFRVAFSYQSRLCGPSIVGYLVYDEFHDQETIRDTNMLSAFFGTHCDVLFGMVKE